MPKSSSTPTAPSAAVAAGHSNGTAEYPAEESESIAAEALYTLLAQFVRQLPRDMSMTATTTLSRLRQSGPQRVTVLATGQGVTQPTMTSLVASLERSGLVVRATDPSDGRASLIGLTADGERYVDARRRRGVAQLAERVQGLPDEQIAALVAAVPALRQLTS